MRRRFIFVFLPLLGLAALVFRGSIEALTDHVVSRLSARKVLASWGLPPTPDNVDLYLSANCLSPAGLGTDADFRGLAEGLQALPKDLRFSTHWNYGQLFENNHLFIGLYDLDSSVTQRLDQIARVLRPIRNRISIRLLRSREDLIDSLAHDTIVLYFGHANVGKGIRFDAQNAAEPLWMGRDTLEVPRNTLSDADVVLADLGDGFVRIKGGSQGLRDLVVNCKVFGYFGCRSDQYFREIWNAHFPNVDFIATTYVCTTITLAPEILQKLVLGLQEGHTLGEIVKDLNQGKSATILFGRIKETTKYRNPNDHADVLFTY